MFVILDNVNVISNAIATQSHFREHYWITRIAHSSLKLNWVISCDSTSTSETQILLRGSPLPSSDVRKNEESQVVTEVSSTEEKMNSVTVNICRAFFLAEDSKKVISVFSNAVTIPSYGSHKSKYSVNRRQMFISFIRLKTKGVKKISEVAIKEIEQRDNLLWKIRSASARCLLHRSAAPVSTTHQMPPPKHCNQIAYQEMHCSFTYSEFFPRRHS